MLSFRTSFFDHDDQRPADDSRPELTTIPPPARDVMYINTQQTTADPSGPPSQPEDSRPELNLRFCALPTDRLDYCNQESAFIYPRNGVSVTGSVLKTEITPRNRKPKKSLNLDDLFFFKKALLLFFATHTIKTEKKGIGGKEGRKREIEFCRGHHYQLKNQTPLRGELRPVNLSVFRTGYGFRPRITGVSMPKTPFVIKSPKSIV